MRSESVTNSPFFAKYYMRILLYRFMRMTPERFDHLHSLIRDRLDHKNRESGRRVRGRRPIPSKEKLAVTLRYLATGDSQQSQSFNFRIGRSTVSSIIKVSAWPLLCVKEGKTHQ